MKTRELHEAYKAQEASESCGIDIDRALGSCGEETGWLKARGEQGMQF